MNNEVTAPPARGFRTIRGRLLFWVLAVTVPIYAAALYLSYRSAAERLEAGAARDADELASKLAAHLDTVIRPIEGGVHTVAHELEEVNPPREEYARRIHGILAAWPDVYGSTIAVEVGGQAGGTRPFAPYYFRRAGRIEYSDLALDSYSYRDLPWYRLAADTRTPVWSQPYFDAGGGDIWMVTYSAPFFRKTASGRELAGVVTADLDLAWVREAGRRVTLGPIGVGWLTSPPASRTFVATLGETSRRISGDGTGDETRLREHAERMLAAREDFSLLADGLAHQPTYVSVRLLETLGWRLTVAVPQHELLTEARRHLSRQLWSGAAGFLLLILAVSFVAARVSRPIHSLAMAVGRAEESQLEFELPAPATRDETGVLTAALQRLRDSLRRHVELRAETLAAESRLGHELQIAARIQQSMLPHGAAAQAPAGTRIAATLVPARQVGGDFYDYLELRDGRLLFTVGDVSDKGIPAALFMARLSGLLRVLGNAGSAPEQLLAELNARLVDGNDACMFATLGCGLLNPGTGRLQYASAGHEPPLLRRANGEVLALPVENGPAVGIDAGVEYRLAESYLAPGDTLVLYTDGVTEMESADGVQLGATRVAELIGRDSGDPHELVPHIADMARQYAADSDVADDLTVLAVSLRPDMVEGWTDARGEHWRIRPAATVVGIQQAQRWLRAALLARAVPGERIADTELIAEEVLTNVARNNAARTRELQLSIECTLSPAGIALRFRDDGVAFDPFARAAPRLDADISEREVGGLGIHLVQQVADESGYSFIDGHNVLNILLKYSPTPHGATA